MDGAGHNNVEKFASDYLQRIKQFISHVDRFVIERNLQQEEAYALENESDEDKMISRHSVNQRSSRDPSTRKGS